MTERRGRSGQQLLDIKETRRYLKVKEEALDRSVWRTGFGNAVCRKTDCGMMTTMMMIIHCIGVLVGGVASLNSTEHRRATS